MSRLSAPLLSLLALTQFGCSSNTTSSAQAAANSSTTAADIHPSASLQEVMDGIVDPSADGMWDAVETTVDKDGEHDKQPRSAEEWAEVRRKTITLIEAANLLVIVGRAHEELRDPVGDGERGERGAQLRVIGTMRLFPDRDAALEESLGRVCCR